MTIPRQRGSVVAYVDEPVHFFGGVLLGCLVSLVPWGLLAGAALLVVRYWPWS